MAVRCVPIRLYGRARDERAMDAEMVRCQLPRNPTTSHKLITLLIVRNCNPIDIRHKTICIQVLTFKYKGHYTNPVAGS